MTDLTSRATDPKQGVFDWLKQPENKIPLIFVMGATNVGKSTLMNAASVCGTSEHPTFSTITNELIAKGILGTVEVGKKMRAKYPPEYFKGSGAPAHTQKEAWGMMQSGIAEAAAHGKVAVVIDGQPRNPEQTKWAMGMPNPKLFLHLWCEPEERERRAINRDGQDQAKFELASKRLVDDPRVLFDCLTMLMLAREIVVTVRTTDVHYRPGSVLNGLLVELGVAKEPGYGADDDRRAGECGGEGNGQ